MTYLGFRVNKEGTTPIDDNIAAVMNALEPVNASQLKSFVGMLNYYHRHLPNLADTLEPLYALLRKNVKWKWGEQQQVAFEAAKQLLCSATLLVHYDPEKPLILHCDASPYGLGSVLAHTMQDGTERPIAYASRTLSTPERNYSQIEKEGLAVVYSVKKFHQYLFGKHVTIVTDHKPLLGLLSETVPIPVMAAARIQRWALILAAYDYTLLYRSGRSHANADSMSRLPQVNVLESSQIESYILLTEVANSPVTSEDAKMLSCIPVAIR